MTTTATARSVKIKFIARGNGSYSLAPPDATPGTDYDAAVQIVEITDVPDDVSNAAVIRLWSHTVDCTHVGGAGRFVFAFGELGIGRIIHK